MYRLTVTSALLVILPIAVGVMPPKMQSRRMVFWGACIIGFVFGLLFTSNAYHVKNAYMNLLASPNTIALIGIA